ncbi:hypothetical protein MRX96_029117 [Rhipicephalus microplus]
MRSTPMPTVSRTLFHTFRIPRFQYQQNRNTVHKPQPEKSDIRQLCPMAYELVHQKKYFLRTSTALPPGCVDFNTGLFRMTSVTDRPGADKFGGRRTTNDVRLNTRVNLGGCSFVETLCEEDEFCYDGGGGVRGSAHIKYRLECVHPAEMVGEAPVGHAGPGELINKSTPPENTGASQRPNWYIKASMGPGGQASAIGVCPGQRRRGDGLFGRCESESRLGAADLWRPDLDVSGAKLLESELERLWEQGYRWRHVYSQCVVRSALSAIRHGRLYDPGFCARTLGSTLPIVSDEIAMELEHLSPDDLAFIKFTPNSGLKEGAFLTSGEVLSSAEDKADAAVASAASIAALKDALKAQAMKRKPKNTEVAKDDSNETDDASADSEDVAGVLNYLQQVAKDTASLLDENKERYDVFVPPDVPVVETELSSDLNQRPIFTEEGIQWIPLGQGDEGRSAEETVAQPARVPTAPSASVPPEKERSRDIGRVLNEVALSEGSSAASSPNSDGSSGGAATSATDAPSSSAAMDRPPSPWESKTHGWADSREDSLRLDGWMEFPKETLYPTGAYEGDELLDIGVRQDPAFRRPMRYDTKKPGPTYFYHEPDSSETSLENVENVRRIMMAQHQRNKMRFGTQDDVGQEDAVLDHLKEVGQANGKRHGLVPTGSKEMLEHSYRGALDAGPTPDGFYSALDSSSAYIVLNEAPSSQEEADRVVSSLQRALLLPSGTFSNVRLEGNRVNFKVNPNSQNLNATTVAAKAESLADSLHQNYTIVAAGVVGEGTPTCRRARVHSSYRNMMALPFVQVVMFERFRHVSHNVAFGSPCPSVDF